VIKDLNIKAEKEFGILISFWEELRGTLIYRNFEE
jgi:hypothetical protein